MRKKKQQDPEAGFVSEGSGNKRITPMDIQQKEFRLSFRGYNERDVDKFLDELTEELNTVIEEKRRVSERSAGSGSGTADEEGEAEQVLARARKEAEQILARARKEAVAVSGASGPVSLSGTDAEAVARFLFTEREFLQGLGTLVQSHVETVKEMARAVRETREAARQPVKVEAKQEEPAAAKVEGVTVVDEPAISGVRSDQAGGDDSERSLRELFWSED